MAPSPLHLSPNTNSLSFISLTPKTLFPPSLSRSAGIRHFASRKTLPENKHHLPLAISVLRERERMLLGKRSRPPMKRTTSMSEIGFDLNVDESAVENSKERQRLDGEGYRRNGIPDGGELRFPAMVSPRNNRRGPADFGTTTAHFLQACSLCKRRLGLGRDIYMYRGESAFCSLECRQQQINLDERKEKCSVVSMKKEAEGTETSSSGERIAAA